MARRNRQKQPEQRSSIGALSLALSALVLAGIGFLLRDALGTPYRIYGSVIWVAVLLLTFMCCLLYYSQFVLSLHGEAGWAGGLSLIWRHYTKQADSFLNSFGQSQPSRSRRRTVRARAPEKEAAPPDPDRLPASFKEIGAGMVRSHQALSIARKSAFQRAAGPGFVMLYKGEGIKQVIDLRPHVRTQAVQATTRDGIPVETAVTVTFRVQQSPDDDDQTPYPYDKDAIFQVSYANTMDVNEGMQPWTEQLAPRAAAVLVMQLSRHSLDDLYQVDLVDAAPMEDVIREIRRDLVRTAAAQGLEVLNVTVGQLQVPPDVMAQRIRTWQARWKKEIQVRRAAGDAEAVRRIKKARARVQIEIIETITQNIAAMRRAEKADLADIITLRMIEVLEGAISDSSVQAMIPEQIMTSLVVDASSQMRSWIAPPLDEDEDGQT